MLSSDHHTIRDLLQMESATFTGPARAITTKTVNSFTVSSIAVWEIETNQRRLRLHCPRRLAFAGERRATRSIVGTVDPKCFLMPLLLASGMALVVSGQSGRPSGAPLEVGRPFPGISLPDIGDGRPRTIAEFRGRKVILHVFASW